MNEQRADVRLWVIGNPENRRVASLLAAAARWKLPTPGVTSYLDLLSQRVKLADVVPAGALVRLESPGEHAVVEAELVRRGALLLGDEALGSLTEIEHGRIFWPNCWYRGYAQLLQTIEAELRLLQVRWMNHPAEIPRLFDKATCQATLRALGVPTPQPLREVSGRAVESYDDLRAQMRAASWRRAFVKLRYGSSASGVVALAVRDDQVVATTSVELEIAGGARKLFNSLRVRRYTDERTVAAIVDELCRYEVHVEEWIPKAGLHQRTFDLRLLTIGGRVRHAVLRSSRGPITNLHLGNQRGDLLALLARWPVEAQQATDATCRRVASAFAGCLYVALDVALLPGLRRHAVLEVNAFGDLLPGVMHEGEETYAAELRVALGLP